MGRPKNEHRRSGVTLVVDDRDLAALREWAQDTLGSVDKYAELVREAIEAKLEKAGRLRRSLEASRQRKIWYAECPPIKAER